MVRRYFVCIIVDFEYQWTLTDDSISFVQQSLTDGYNLQPGSLQKQIKELSNAQAETAWKRHQADLLLRLDNSNLAGYDNLNEVENSFKTVFSASVTYIVCQKCGIITDSIAADDFAKIRDFNTTSALCVVGSAIADNARQTLTKPG